MPYYQIVNEHTGEVWNDMWGWVDAEDAECIGQLLVNEVEKETTTLPVEGVWQEV